MNYLNIPCKKMTDVQLLGERPAARRTKKKQKQFESPCSTLPLVAFSYRWYSEKIIRNTWTCRLSFCHNAGENGGHQTTRENQLLTSFLFLLIKFRHGYYCRASHRHDGHIRRPQRDRPHRLPVDRLPTLHRRLHCLAACMSALKRKEKGFNLGSVICSFPFSSPLIYARRDRVEDVFGFLTRTSA